MPKPADEGWELVDTSLDEGGWELVPTQERKAPRGMLPTSQDVPGMVSSAIAGLVPGAREALDYLPYALPINRPDLGIINRLPPQERAVAAFGVNTAVDLINAASSIPSRVALAGPGAASLESARPSAPLGRGAELQRPYPTSGLVPQAVTPAGKAASFGLEIGAGLLSGVGISKLAKIRSAAILNSKKFEAEGLAAAQELDRLKLAKNATPAHFKEVEAKLQAVASRQTENLVNAADEQIRNFDDAFYGAARPTVLKGRETAQKFINSQYEYFDDVFLQAAKGQRYSAQTAESISAQLDALQAANPGVNVPQIKRLQETLSKATEGHRFGVNADVALKHLYKQFSAAPNMQKGILAKAKDILISHLETGGPGDIAVNNPILKARDEYAQFAKLRDGINKFVDPYESTFATEAHTGRLKKMIDYYSNPSPKNAENVADLEAFLQQYRDIDPEFTGLVEQSITARRPLLEGKLEVLKRSEEVKAANARYFAEIQRERIQGNAATMKELEDKVLAAKTMAEKALAQDKVFGFIRNKILAPTIRVAPTLAKYAAGGASIGAPLAYVVSRAIQGSKNSAKSDF